MTSWCSQCRRSICRLDTSAPDRPRLVRDALAEAAYLVYVFPPQSIAEQAFFETVQIQNQPGFNPPLSTPPLPGLQPLPTPEAPTAPGSVAAWVAGQSRLVFRLPSGLAEVEFSIAGLLDWSQLEPVLPAAAQVLPGAPSGQSGPPPIAAPGSLETSLELPYRLMMSPNVMPGGVQPGWEHAAAPVLHAGRAELWHTRLGQLGQADGRSSSPRRARPRRCRCAPSGRPTSWRTARCPRRPRHRRPSPSEPPHRHGWRATATRSSSSPPGSAATRSPRLRPTPAVRSRAGERQPSVPVRAGRLAHVSGRVAVSGQLPALAHAPATLARPRTPIRPRRRPTWWGST